MQLSEVMFKVLYWRHTSHRRDYAVTVGRQSTLTLVKAACYSLEVLMTCKEYRQWFVRRPDYYKTGLRNKVTYVNRTRAILTAVSALSRTSAQICSEQGDQKYVDNLATLNSLKEYRGWLLLS